MRALIFLLLPLTLTAQTPEQLFQERRYDEAYSAFRAQLAKDKTDANAMYYIGRIAYAQGKTGEAIDWFERAIHQNEKNATYHLWLGNAVGDEAQRASKLRQPFLARKVKAEFERAVALDPTLVGAREGLVNFYSMASGFMGGSKEKAREQASELLKLNPMIGHVHLGRLAEREKDLATAEREYKAALTAAPDSAQPYYGLAGFYRNQQRWDEAFAVYEQLMQRKPSEVNAHLAWAGTAAQSGKNLERGEREARLFLETATDAPPATRSNAHWRLGQILEQTSRKDQARAQYLEALKLNPQNQNAKRSLEAMK